MYCLEAESFEAGQNVLIGEDDERKVLLLESMNWKMARC